MLLIPFNAFNKCDYTVITAVLSRYNIKICLHIFDINIETKGNINKSIFHFLIVLFKMYPEKLPDLKENAYAVQAVGPTLHNRTQTQNDTYFLPLQTGEKSHVNQNIYA